MSTQAALKDLQTDVKKKSLADLLDRSFVNVSGSESDVTVMQWNVLAQGKHVLQSQQNSILTVLHPYILITC
jgi:hypothetical protein